MEISDLISEGTRYAGSLSALARNLGVSRVSLMNWRAGAHAPRGPLFEKLVAFVSDASTRTTEEARILGLLRARNATPEEIFAAGQAFALRSQSPMRVDA